MKGTPPAMAFPSLAVWKRAVSFHFFHMTELWPIFPLFFCPILGDALQSLLIHHELNQVVISRCQAVRRALCLSWLLLPMKLYFMGLAILYALIPIYGIIQDIKHRLYWAMASNVLVFENLSGEKGRARCRAIVDSYSVKMQARTLVIVPTVMMVGSLLLAIFIRSWFEIDSPFVPIVIMLTAIWICIPLSGAANTFLYLEIAKQAGCSATTDSREMVSKLGN